MRHGECIAIVFFIIYFLFAIPLGNRCIFNIFKGFFFVESEYNKALALMLEDVSH